jgi:hypothetical protein
MVFSVAVWTEREKIARFVPATFGDFDDMVDLNRQFMRTLRIATPVSGVRQNFLHGRSGNGNPFCRH